MPGPCAKNRTTRAAAPNTPARKTARRLKARQDGFSQSNDKYRGGFHLAGSQNRNK